MLQNMIRILKSTAKICYTTEEKEVITNPGTPQRTLTILSQAHSSSVRILCSEATWGSILANIQDKWKEIANSLSLKVYSKFQELFLTLFLLNKSIIKATDTDLLQCLTQDQSKISIPRSHLSFATTI